MKKSYRKPLIESEGILEQTSLACVFVSNWAEGEPFVGGEELCSSVKQPGALTDLLGSDCTVRYGEIAPDVMTLS